MTYVLIVVSWLGGTVNGAGVSTQEFSSVERCEAARIALVERTPRLARLRNQA